MNFLLTVGERHEVIEFEQLMERGAIQREGASSLAVETPDLMVEAPMQGLSSKGAP